MRVFPLLVPIALALVLCTLVQTAIGTYCDAIIDACNTNLELVLNGGEHVISSCEDVSCHFYLDLFDAASVTLRNMTLPAGLDIYVYSEPTDSAPLISIDNCTFGDLLLFNVLEAQGPLEVNVMNVSLSRISFDGTGLTGSALRFVDSSFTIGPSTVTTAIIHIPFSLTDSGVQLERNAVSIVGEPTSLASVVRFCGITECPISGMEITVKNNIFSWRDGTLSGGTFHIISSSASVVTDFYLDVSGNQIDYNLGSVTRIGSISVVMLRESQSTGDASYRNLSLTITGNVVSGVVRESGTEAGSLLHIQNTLIAENSVLHIDDNNVTIIGESVDDYAMLGLVYLGTRTSLHDVLFQVRSNNALFSGTNIRGISCFSIISLLQEVASYSNVSIHVMGNRVNASGQTGGLDLYPLFHAELYNVSSGLVVLRLVRISVADNFVVINCDLWRGHQLPSIWFGMVQAGVDASPLHVSVLRNVFIVENVTARFFRVVAIPKNVQLRNGSTVVVEGNDVSILASNISEGDASFVAVAGFSERIPRATPVLRISNSDVTVSDNVVAVAAHVKIVNFRFFGVYSGTDLLASRLEFVNNTVGGNGPGASVIFLDFFFQGQVPGPDSQRDNHLIAEGNTIRGIGTMAHFFFWSTPIFANVSLSANTLQTQDLAGGNSTFFNVVATPGDAVLDLDGAVISLERNKHKCGIAGADGMCIGVHIAAPSELVLRNEASVMLHASEFIYSGGAGHTVVRFASEFLNITGDRSVLDLRENVVEVLEAAISSDDDSLALLVHVPSLRASGGGAVRVAGNFVRGTSSVGAGVATSPPLGPTFGGQPSITVVRIRGTLTISGHRSLVALIENEVEVSSHDATRITAIWVEEPIEIESGAVLNVSIHPRVRLVGTATNVAEIAFLDIPSTSIVRRNSVVEICRNNVSIDSATTGGHRLDVAVGLLMRFTDIANSSTLTICRNNFTITDVHSAALMGAVVFDRPVNLSESEIVIAANAILVTGVRAATAVVQGIACSGTLSMENATLLTAENRIYIIHSLSSTDGIHFLIEHRGHSSTATISANVIRIVANATMQEVHGDTWRARSIHGVRLNNATTALQRGAVINVSDNDIDIATSNISANVVAISLPLEAHEAVDATGGAAAFVVVERNAVSVTLECSPDSRSLCRAAGIAVRPRDPVQSAASSSNGTINISVVSNDIHVSSTGFFMLSTAALVVAHESFEWNARLVDASKVALVDNVVVVRCELLGSCNCTAIAVHHLRMDNGSILSCINNTVGLNAFNNHPTVTAAPLLFANMELTSTSQLHVSNNSVDATSIVPNGTLVGVWVTGANVSASGSKLSIRGNSVNCASLSRVVGIAVVALSIADSAVCLLDANSAAVRAVGTSVAAQLRDVDSKRATLALTNSGLLSAITQGRNPNYHGFNDAFALAIAVDVGNLRCSDDSTVDLVGNQRLLSSAAETSALSIGMRLEHSEFTSGSNVTIAQSAMACNEVASKEAMTLFSHHHGSALSMVGTLLLHAVRLTDTGGVLTVDGLYVSRAQPAQGRTSHVVGVLLSSVQLDAPGVHSVKQCVVVMEINGTVADTASGLRVLLETSIGVGGQLDVVNNELRIFVTNLSTAEGGDGEEEGATPKMLLSGINGRGSESPHNISGNHVVVRSTRQLLRVAGIVGGFGEDKLVRASNNVIALQFPLSVSDSSCFVTPAHRSSGRVLLLDGNTCMLQVDGPGADSHVSRDVVASFVSLTHAGVLTAAFMGPPSSPTDDHPPLLIVARNVLNVTSEGPGAVVVVFINGSGTALGVLEHAALVAEANVMEVPSGSSAFLVDLRGWSFVSGTLLLSANQHHLALPPAVGATSSSRFTSTAMPFDGVSLHVVLRCNTAFSGEVIVTTFPGAELRTIEWCWTNTSSPTLSTTLSRSDSESPSSSGSPTGPTSTLSLPPTQSATFTRTQSNSAATPSHSIPPTASGTLSATASLSVSLTNSATNSVSSSVNFCELDTTPHFKRSVDVLEEFSMKPVPSPSSFMPSPPAAGADSDGVYGVRLRAHQFISSGRTANMTLKFAMELRNYFGEIVDGSGVPTIELMSTPEMRVFLIQISTTRIIEVGVELLADSTFLRRDRVLHITVARSGFICPLGGFDFNFTLQLLRLEPAIPQEVVEAVQATATTTVAASSIVGSPTGMMQQTRLNALMSLTYCIFSHEETMTVLSNPLHFRFGSRHGSFYRGSVVGGFVLMLIASLVMVLLGWLAFKLRGHRMSNQDVLDATHLSQVEKTMAFLHFPGVLIVPFSLVAEGVVASATALSVHGRDNGDFVVAAFGYAIIWGPIVGCIMLTRCFFGCELRPRHVEDNKRLRAQYGKWTVYLFRTEKKWVDHTRRGLFKKKYLHIFQDYAMPHWVTMEVAVSSLIGVLEGVRISETTTCTTIISLITLVFFLLFLSGLYFRPCLDRFNGFFMHSINGLSFTAAALLLIGHTRDDDAFRESQEWLSLAIMCLATIKFLFDALNLALWLRGNKEKVTSMWRMFADVRGQLTEDEMNAIADARATELEEPLVASSNPNHGSAKVDSAPALQPEVSNADARHARGGTDTDLPPSHTISYDDDADIDDLLFGPSSLTVDAADEAASLGGSGGAGGAGRPRSRPGYRTAEAQRYFDEIRRGLERGTFESGGNEEELEDDLNILNPKVGFTQEDIDLL